MTLALMESEEEILILNPEKKRKSTLPAAIKQKEVLKCQTIQSNEQTFHSLGLDSWLVKILQDLSIFTPTEIQVGCIPIITSAGNDLIASAKTGSGKTATFALPILQSLSKDPFGVFALVLTPTRELAIQIAEQFKVLGAPIHLKTSVILGGLDLVKQTIELSKRPHVVISTPGRLADILTNSSDLNVFGACKYLVLDEADRLLNPSFRQELQSIVNRINCNRQTLLFSATMSRVLNDVDFLNMKNPVTFHVNEEYGTVDKINQEYIFIPAKMRYVYLSYLLEVPFKGKSVIIFVGKCKTAEMLKVMLRNLSFSCVSLHSLMPQNDRISSLGRFKSAVVPILISTDVGSRGLDIPSVEVVINFDIPCDARDYVHRIGRTARAGRGGLALSLVTEYDIELIKNIEAKTKKQMTEFETPENEVLKSLNRVLEAKRLALLNLSDRNVDAKKRKRPSESDE